MGPACVFFGRVPGKMVNAAQYYRNAAVQGDANGAYNYNYGWMYLKGVGVDKNNDIAKRWLKTAANAGHADAKAILKQEGWLDEKPLICCTCELNPPILPHAGTPFSVGAAKTPSRISNSVVSGSLKIIIRR